MILIFFKKKNKYAMYAYVDTFKSSYRKEN